MRQKSYSRPVDWSTPLQAPPIVCLPVPKTWHTLDQLFLCQNHPGLSSAISKKQKQIWWHDGYMETKGPWKISHWVRKTDANHLTSRMIFLPSANGHISSPIWTENVLGVQITSTDQETYFCPMFSNMHSLTETKQLYNFSVIATKEEHGYVRGTDIVDTWWPQRSSKHTQSSLVFNALPDLPAITCVDQSDSSVLSQPLINRSVKWHEVRIAVVGKKTVVKICT